MEPVGHARVLIVEDDASVASGFRRILAHQGYEVVVVERSIDALPELTNNPPDVLLSDIGLPDFSGVQLLAIVKELQPELPVVLVTGTPQVDSAVAAVSHGAVDYLVKPTSPQSLLRAVDRALTLGRLAAARRELANLPHSDHELSDVAQAFENALDGLRVVYQPIVASHEPRVIGYEVLLRTQEQLYAGPLDLFAAAERLERVHELGRIIRHRAITPVNEMESEVRLFVNLHPLDLLDEDLYDHDSIFASNAQRIVLEITERARLDSVDNLFARIARLRNLGFRMAIDDIGAGYSGLSTFAHIEPDVVKVDTSLVRGIDMSPAKQRILGSLVSLCNELQVKTVAEGVETEAEQECCANLGCTWLQGYRFAMPGEAFPVVHWGALHRPGQ